MKSAESAPTRSVGRPRQFDRDQALATAMDLFWRHGYEGVSTTELTAAMGISQPSLYAAFGSKEALYREALDLYLAHYGCAMGEALSAPGNARQAIEAMLRVAAQQFSGADHAPGCMVASAGLHGSAQNAAVFESVAQMRQGSQYAIHARLELGRAAGELPAGQDCDALAAYFAMVIQGMAVQARDGATPQRLQQLAEMALRTWPI